MPDPTVLSEVAADHEQHFPEVALSTTCDPLRIPFLRTTGAGKSVGRLAFFFRFRPACGCPDPDCRLSHPDRADDLPGLGPASQFPDLALNIGRCIVQDAEYPALAVRTNVDCAALGQGLYQITTPLVSLSFMTRPFCGPYPAAVSPVLIRSAWRTLRVIDDKMRKFMCRFQGRDPRLTDVGGDNDLSRRLIQA